MCRGPTNCQKLSVPKTAINTIPTMRPTYRAPRSRTSEGVDRGEGDKSSPCRLKDGCAGEVSGTTPVPRLANDFLDGRSRRSRARCVLNRASYIASIGVVSSSRATRRMRRREFIAGLGAQLAQLDAPGAE